MATKFLEIEVTRPVSSVLYVEVDESFDFMKDLRKLDLDKIAQATTQKRDWEDDGITDVEYNSAKFVSAEVAKDYNYYDQINNKVNQWADRD